WPTSGLGEIRRSDSPQQRFAPGRVNAPRAGVSLARAATGMRGRHGASAQAGPEGLCTGR
ncbi:MAG: hypothetical protein ACK559_10340, partial [bacterium]